MRDLVASGAGVGFVAEAEFRPDPRLIRLPLAGSGLVMEETVVCLRRRAEVRRIGAFMAIAGTASRG